MTAFIGRVFGTVVFLTFVLSAQGPPPGRGPSPKIVVTPNTVYFHKIGNETLLVRTLKIHRPGPPGGALAATTTLTPVTGGNWLTAGPLSGDRLTLTANPGSLGPGVYETMVTVNSGGASDTTRAFLRILNTGQGEAAPAFVRPVSLSFRMVQGGPNPDPRTLTVSSPTGGASFSWTATRTIATPPGGTWLQISNAALAQNGPGFITVSVNGSGLAAGQYTGTIIVTSGATSVQVPVTLEVAPPASAPAVAFQVSPRVLNFVVLPNSPAPGPQTLHVTSNSSSAVNWSATATSNGNWLSIGAGSQSGTTPGLITVMVNPGSLSPGLYEGGIQVTGGGTSQTVRVFLRIAGPSRGEPSAPTPRPIPTGVQVMPRAIEFSSTGGTVTPASATVQITSDVSGLSYTASGNTGRGGAWLNITPSSTTIPSTINVTVNPAGLMPGVYTGLILLNITGAVNEQRVVLVTLRVSAPGELARLQAQPGGVNFVASPGGPNPAAAAVTVEPHGAASIPFQATVTTVRGGTWLSVSPATGTAPTTVNVSANISGLAPGVYQGFVVFQATGSPGALPATLNVHLTVAADGASAGVRGLFLEPGPEFVRTAGSPAPVRVLVTDLNGRPVNDAVVRVTVGGDRQPVTLEPIRDGIYAGAVTSRTGGPVSLTATVERLDGSSAEFSVGGDLEGAEESAPMIFEEGIVSTASFAPGATPLAAGSIASLFGVNLADSTATAGSLPLPRELAGVRVLVGGIEAPLISVAADEGAGFDQINFQIPYEVARMTYVDVVVIRGGFYSVPVGISIAPGLPSVFTLSQQGSGAAAALHADFGLISASRPARAGQTILLFATGLGAVQPGLGSGQAAGPGNRVTGAVEVRIGGRPARVSFAGLAPGFAGLYQLNVEVPEGLARGDATVEVSIDGIGSGEGVVIPVG